MKKIFSLARAAAAVLLGTMALTANAETVALTFGTQLPLPKGQATIYSYKPTTNGVLSLTFGTNGDNSVVFTTTNSSGPVYASSQVDLTSNYDLNANVTYYIYNTNYYVDATITAAWTPSDAPVEEGTFTPMTTTKVSLDAAVAQSATYQSFNYASEGGISGPNTCIEFTAMQNGTLTLTQGVSYESHLYLVAWNKLQTFDPDANLVPASYPSETTGIYPLTYKVDQGSTYYFYAKVGQYDNITNMYYTWAPSGSNDDIPVAKLNETFNCYNTVYQYTPPVSGIMSVLLNKYDFNVVGANNLLYTNATCTTKVEQLSWEDYDADQVLVNYYVQAGKPYYFQQDQSSTLTCTIIEMIEKEQAIILDVANLNPMPGDASWNENIANYGSGFKYDFNPSDVTVASATVSYITESGETVTSTYTTTSSSLGDATTDLEYQGGGWVVRLYQALEGFKANGKANTYLTVTLNNIRYNGQQMPIELSAVTDAKAYIDIDNTTGSISLQYFKAAQEMTYNSSMSQWPSVIYQEWEEGDVNGIATLVFSNPIKQIGAATVTLGNQTWGAVSGGDEPDPSADIPYEISNNVLTLKFNKISIPVGTKSYSTCTIFITGVEDMYGQGMGIPSVDMKLPYSATTAPDPVIAMQDAMVIQPEGNSYSLAMDAFIVQWSENTLSAKGTMTADVYINEKKVGTAPISITKGEITGADDSLSIDITAYKGTYGAYMIYIPQGVVENEEGMINPAQYISCYIFETNNDYVITPTPGTLNTLDEPIKITFEGASLAINPNAGAAEWSNNTLPASVAYDSLVIPMVDVAPGTYTLTIPATYLVINNESLNPEISEEYTILTSGVDGLIDADTNGLYNVYNMNGVKVASGDESVVKGLAKGLYIINGKKVIVK